MPKVVYEEVGRQPGVDKCVNKLFQKLNSSTHMGLSSFSKDIAEAKFKIRNYFHFVLGGTEPYTGPSFRVLCQALRLPSKNHLRVLLEEVMAEMEWSLSTIDKVFDNLPIE